LCHGMVCVVGRIRDLILQLSKSSIYSTKPFAAPSPAPTDSMSYIIPYRLSLNINKMNICST
ncbi:hypothetical protein F9224_12110, partial [Escherichia coli]